MKEIIQMGWQRDPLHHRRVCAVLVAISLFGGGSLLTRDAHAKDDPKVLFQQATTLIEKKDCKGAEPLLQRVYSETKSPNALLYIARCARDEKRLPEAYQTYGQVIVESSAERYEKTREAATLERKELESQIGRVTVSVAGLPVGALVTVNGKATTEFDSVMAVLPGQVAVNATARGFQPFQEVQMVKEGSAATFKVVLKPEAVAVVEPTPTPSEPIKKTVMTGGELRWVGVGLVGLGVVGMGTFVVARVGGDTTYRDLEEKCVKDACTEKSFNDGKSSGKTLDTLANVGLIGGAVALVAGGILIAVGGPKEKAVVERASLKPKPKTSPTVTPYLGLSAVGVTGTF
jgi:hypothetical protein